MSPSIGLGPQEVLLQLSGPTLTHKSPKVREEGLKLLKTSFNMYPEEFRISKWVFDIPLGYLCCYAMDGCVCDVFTWGICLFIFLHECQIVFWDNKQTNKLSMVCYLLENLQTQNPLLLFTLRLYNTISNTYIISTCLQACLRVCLLFNHKVARNFLGFWSPKKCLNLSILVQNWLNFGSKKSFSICRLKPTKLYLYELTTNQIVGSSSRYLLCWVTALLQSETWPLTFSLWAMSSSVTKLKWICLKLKSLRTRRKNCWRLFVYSGFCDTFMWHCVAFWC